GLVECILFHGLEAALRGVLPQSSLAARSSGSEEVPKLLIEDEKLVDAQATTHSRTHAGRAAAAPAEAPRLKMAELGAQRVLQLRGEGIPLQTSLADTPHQPLSEDAVQTSRYEPGVDAHVGEACKGAERVLGMDRGENQVTGQGGTAGDIRRL